MNEPHRIVVDVTGGSFAFDFDTRTVTSTDDPEAARFVKGLMDVLSEPPHHLVGSQVDELVGLTGSWDGSILNAVAALTEAGFDIVGWAFTEGAA